MTDFIAKMGIAAAAGLATASCAPAPAATATEPSVQVVLITDPQFEDKTPGGVNRIQGECYNKGLAQLRRNNKGLPAIIHCVVLIDGQDIIDATMPVVDKQEDYEQFQDEAENSMPQTVSYDEFVGNLRSNAGRVLEIGANAFGSKSVVTIWSDGDLEQFLQNQPARMRKPAILVKGGPNAVPKV